MSYTTSFYVPPDMISDAHVRFPADEAHHASRVLRNRPGDVVRVFDGEGTAYQVRLTQVEATDVQGEVMDSVPGENEPGYDLTLAVGLLKQRARFETMIEKVVELGVRAVVPLITARTERSSLRDDRLDRIVTAAAKQCGRCRLPSVADPVDIHDFIADASFDIGVICHEAATDGSSLEAAIGRPAGLSIGILIGPEGGFEDVEVEAAATRGYHIAHLGSRRLRTETAAVVAAAACMLLETRIHPQLE